MDATIKKEAESDDVCEDEMWVATSLPRLGLGVSVRAWEAKRPMMRMLFGGKNPGVQTEEGAGGRSAPD